MRRLNTLAPLWAGFFIIVAITAVVGWRINLDYRKTIAAAETLLATLARSGDEQLSGQLQSIDVLLLGVESQLRSAPRGAPPSMGNIAAQLQHVRGLRVLAVTNASGRIVFATRPDLLGFDASSRPYFTVPRDAQGEDSLHLGGPFTASDGERVLYVARARRDASGRFDGVILATLLPEFLAPLVHTIRPDSPASTAAIVSSDFAMLYRLPDAQQSIGKSLRGAPGISAHVAGGQKASIQTIVAVVDGVTRITALRTVEPYGLYVTVGLPRDEVLAPFYRHSAAHIGLYVFVILLTVWLMTLLRRKEQRLRLLSGVFNESGEGILITDCENRIITVNAAFSRLTGYSESEVIGKNPRLLSAGKTPLETYQQLWTSLETRDAWQGELWDRRKNGEIYPKWLSISVVRDNAGKALNYIGAFVDIAERKASEERVRYLAYHDPLTDLPNRFSLNERLAYALPFCKRNSKQMALMLIDLDHFKIINDTLGHPVGDKLLIQVAGRLRDSVRDSDMVARLGGDEFVVVLAGIDSPADAENVAGKIVKTVSEPYLIDGTEQRTSPSIGICIYPDDATETDELLKHADVAMYRAKAAGRGRFVFFTRS